MKAFSKSLVVALLLATCQTLTVQSKPRLSESQQFERYLSSIGTDIYSAMARAKAKAPATPVANSPSYLRKFARNLRLKSRKLKQTAKAGQRKLYESRSAGFLMGDGSDIAAVGQLDQLMSEDAGMAASEKIKRMLNDLGNDFDSVDIAVKQKMQDLQTGLQRRNMLLGHYNYANAALAAPMPGSIGVTTNSFSGMSQGGHF